MAHNPLVERILKFIDETFDENDMRRARAMGEWIGSDTSREELILQQEQDLVQMDLARLQFLDQLALLIRGRDMEGMFKDSMNPNWIADGFILIHGKVVMTYPC
jgi:hypothetical protein